jgi:ABC-type nitrate/sulfonate/bicarbonate transport system permease component
MALWVPVALMGAWEAAARFEALNPLFFPPPSQTAMSAVKLTLSGELPALAAATMGRAFTGFAAGALLGLVTGALMGEVAALRRLLEPTFSALYSAPKLTFFPLLLLLLGVGEPARVAVVVIGTFLLVVMQVYDAVRSIDRGYVEMAANHGASRWMILRRVYLPASLPQVFTALRIAFGRALVLTVSVELLTGSTGLGSMIWMAWQSFSTERLYVGVGTACMLGFATHRGLQTLERRLLPWSRQE